METFILNFSGRAVRKVHRGRTYLVADASILVPGVLNGSKGALLYPNDECAAKPGIWNGVPLVLYHPTDPITNEHISATDDGVLDRQGLGFTRNDRWEGGRRRVEGWFDEERVRNLAADVHRRLVNGQPIELSTGLFTDNEDASPGSHFKGRPYDYVARNYRPDHIAILPDQVGACSINDGCGVFNASGLRKEEHLLNEGQTCNRCGGHVVSNVCNRCGAEMVTNPARSEAQRRYLNMEFGHDWVKEHDFDNKGPLPETVGNALAELVTNSCSCSEAEPCET